MKKTLRKIAILTMLVALISTTVLGCARREIDHGAVLSTVNGAEITLGLANFYARILQAQEEMSHMLSPWAGENPNPVDAWGDNPMTGVSREVEIKEFILENLQGMFLKYQNAPDFGVVLSPEDRTRIQEAAALFVEQNDEQTRAAISGQAEVVELFLELMTVSERMIVAMGAGIDEEVSPEESVQKGADAVVISFTSVGADGTTAPMDEIERAVLLVQAQAVLEGLGAEDSLDAFEDLGDVFPITFGAETPGLDTEFLEALNALTAEGQRTGLVQTDTGIFVGQLTSLFDEEATNNQIERILEERRSERFDSLMEEWRAAANITENLELWDQVSFVDLGIAFYEPEVTRDAPPEDLQLEEILPEEEEEDVDEDEEDEEDEEDDAADEEDGEEPEEVEGEEEE